MALLAKGGQLAVVLRGIDPGWATLALATGAVAGVLKAKFLFSRFCRRNLDRIAALEAPRIWQFFRPQFFFALGLMIAAGAALSKLAMLNFAMLVFVVALDLSLAIALLGSLPIFRSYAARHE